MAIQSGIIKNTKSPKKTRQGNGRNTKSGNKGGGPKGSTTSKLYKKKSRGQGRQMEIQSKYVKGDVVTINDKDWTIESVTMRFGRQMTYGLERENKNGERQHINIETGSLETMIGNNQ